MKIQVNSKDFGWLSAQPITIQKFDEYDDDGEHYQELLWCNHAGAEETTIDCGYPDSIIGDFVDDDRQALVCDKCESYRFLDRDEWEDAPTEGKHHE